MVTSLIAFKVLHVGGAGVIGVQNDFANGTIPVIIGYQNG
jgi:hypothetical protein